MINLIPKQEKRDLEAARRNTLLLKYSIIVLSASLVMAGIMYGYSMLLSNTEASAKNLIETNSTEAGIYSDTKKEVGILTEKLSSIRTVTSNEVKISKLLVNIANLMPAGTIVNSIEIDSQNISNPSTMKVSGKSTENIVALQTAFRSSTIFKEVNFETIAENDNDPRGYNASVTLNVVFNQEGI